MKTDLNKVIFADSREELRNLEHAIMQEISRKPFLAKRFEEKSQNAFLQYNMDLAKSMNDTFTPTYNEVIEAGFRRQAPESRDDVFNEAHGYPYFLVNYEAENVIIEWDILTHELTISVCDVLIGKISFEKAKEIIEASEPQSSNQ
jgi:NRPS condensation-like uncharacterized protein